MNIYIYIYIYRSRFFFENIYSLGGAPNGLGIDRVQAWGYEVGRGTQRRERNRLPLITKRVSEKMSENSKQLDVFTETNYRFNHFILPLFRKHSLVNNLFCKNTQFPKKPWKLGICRESVRWQKKRMSWVCVLICTYIYIYINIYMDVNLLLYMP